MRPASEVAHDVCEEMEEYGPYFAVMTIEADRAEVRLAEREAVVKWLRKTANMNPQSPEAKSFVLLLCNAIEAGEHLK
jgi:hypothetical protein